MDCLLRLANGVKVPKYEPYASYTAKMFTKKFIAKRKSVLFNLFATYRNKRNTLAAGRDPLSVPIDLCVPDEDVESDRFCEILNQRSLKRKDQPNFKLTKVDLHVSELIGCDQDVASDYICGAYGDDFSLGRSEQDIAIPNSSDLDAAIDNELERNADNNDEDDDLRMSLATAAKKLRAEGPVTRRRLRVVSALQRLNRLRRFHNNHVA